MLKAFVKAGKDAKPEGDFTTMGKQAVYRYYDPVKLLAPLPSTPTSPKYRYQ